MSRNKYYDEDDMYDDYYYDEEDNYDEQDNYHYEKPYEQASLLSSNSLLCNSVAESVGKESKSRDSKDDPVDYVQFVMEALGPIKLRPDGTREIETSGLSETRVLQMLEMYAYDTDKVINYFLASKTAASSSGTPKSTGGATSGKASASSQSGKNAVKSIQQPQKQGNVGKGGGLSMANAIKSKESNVSKVASTANASASSSQVPQRKKDTDVTDMGFSIPSSEPSLEPSLGHHISTSTSTSMSGTDYPSDEEEISSSDAATIAARLSDKSDNASSSSSSSSSSSTLTLVVAGHVDAGKSTLIGNLLYLVGNVSQRIIHKYEKESKEGGKASFAFAWVMDEGTSEREHGVTINVAERHLQTPSKNFTILDAPGHRDFIPNMIAGTSQAHVAMLVVPAAVGEFESSMDAKAQTREHAVVLKALGINQVVVVINKMDMTNPPWSQQRFLHIQNVINSLLVQDLHFPPRAVRFVPLSGSTGENIVSLSQGCPMRSWYSGPTLVHALDNFKSPQRLPLVEKPLRALVTAPLSEGPKGCDVCVTILQGRLRVGSGVAMVTNSGGVATVKKIISNDGSPVSLLLPGEQATITLVDRNGRSGDEMGLWSGSILCKGQPRARMHTKFKATILTMPTLQVPLIPGSKCDLYIHGEEVLCHIAKLYGLQKSKTDMILNPKSIACGQSAHVKIVTEVPVCLENFSICNTLGRFVLRCQGHTIAVGIVENTKKKT